MQYKPYSIYGTDGFINRVVRVHETFDISAMLRDGEQAIEGVSTPGCDRVVNGELVKAPDAPSPEYIFDQKKGIWVHDTIQVKQSVLQKRQSLLNGSDWTQLPDVPLATKNAWAAYRQSLRDITVQPEFPIAVVWPIQPVG